MCQDWYLSNWLHNERPRLAGNEQEWPRTTRGHKNLPRTPKVLPKVKARHMKNVGKRAILKTFTCSSTESMTLLTIALPLMYTTLEKPIYIFVTDTFIKQLHLTCFCCLVSLPIVRESLFWTKVVLTPDARKRAVLMGRHTFRRISGVGGLWEWVPQKCNRCEVGVHFIFQSSTYREKLLIYHASDPQVEKS